MAAKLLIDTGANHGFTPEIRKTNEDIVYRKITLKVMGDLWRNLFWFMLARVKRVNIHGLKVSEMSFTSYPEENEFSNVILSKQEGRGV